MLADRVIQGDALAVLKTLPNESVQCCVTSPPYWGLRDYGVLGQLGLEETPEEWVGQMVAVFAEVRRVLRADGTLWLNVGDCYANNASTSAIPRAEQGNGTGVFRVPGEHHVQARRQMANRLTPMKRVGLKHKDLVGLPWMLAFALRSDGWWLRSDIIWHKPNPMPESVRDRPTRAHEYIFLLTKSSSYFYDADAIREPLAAKTYTTFGTKHRAQGNDALGRVKSDNWGRTVSERQPRLNAAGEIAGANKRSVWTVATAAFANAHFATFPLALIEPCVLAGSRPGDVVLDPFGGAGTTGVVAKRHSRHYVLIELNGRYCEMSEERIAGERQPVLWTACAAG